MTPKIDAAFYLHLLQVRQPGDAACYAGGDCSLTCDLPCESNVTCDCIVTFDCSVTCDRDACLPCCRLGPTARSIRRASAWGRCFAPVTMVTCTACRRWWSTGAGHEPQHVTLQSHVTVLSHVKLQSHVTPQSHATPTSRVTPLAHIALQSVVTRATGLM